MSELVIYVGCAVVLLGALLVCAYELGRRRGRWKETVRLMEACRTWRETLCTLCRFRTQAVAGDSGRQKTPAIDPKPQNFAGDNGAGVRSYEDYR